VEPVYINAFAIAAKVASTMDGKIACRTRRVDVDHGHPSAFNGMSSAGPWLHASSKLRLDSVPQIRVKSLRT
jgi:hypothetical protein